MLFIRHSIRRAYNGAFEINWLPIRYPIRRTFLTPYDDPKNDVTKCSDTMNLYDDAGSAP